MDKTISDRDLLIAIHEKLGSIEGRLTLWRWIFGSTVVGGSAWMSWLTVTLVSGP
jgi:hypothetical protein